MKFGLKKAGAIFCLTAAMTVFGPDLLGQSQEASAARNESRWFLQNVCLANANQVLGKPDWVKYQYEATQARARLRKNGVPEAHLQEMESFAIEMIRASTQPGSNRGGPKLCKQWYST